MTPGFTRNSAPLWARGQDAFLVIRRLRVQSQPAAIVCEPRFATVLSTSKRWKMSKHRKYSIGSVQRQAQWRKALVVFFPDSSTEPFLNKISYFITNAKNTWFQLPTLNKYVCLMPVLHVLGSVIKNTSHKPRNHKLDLESLCANVPVNIWTHPLWRINRHNRLRRSCPQSWGCWGMSSQTAGSSAAPCTVWHPRPEQV